MCIQSRLSVNIIIDCTNFSDYLGGNVYIARLILDPCPGEHKKEVPPPQNCLRQITIYTMGLENIALPVLHLH